MWAHGDRPGWGRPGWRAGDWAGMGRERTCVCVPARAHTPPALPTGSDVAAGPSFRLLGPWEPRSLLLWELEPALSHSSPAGQREGTCQVALARGLGPQTHWALRPSGWRLTSGHCRQVPPAPHLPAGVPSLPPQGFMGLRHTETMADTASEGGWGTAPVTWTVLFLSAPRGCLSG